MRSEQDTKSLLKVISFGEVLWDLLPDGPVLGGAPCNFAYKLSKCDVEVRLVSQVGKDDFGKKALSELARLGVSTEFISISDHATGTVTVSVDKGGNPDYEIHKSVAYDFIDVNQAVLDYAKNCDCIAFGTLIQRNKQSREALESLLKVSSNCTKFLDINLRKECFTPEIIELSLERTDILKFNKDELFYLCKLFGLPSDSMEQGAKSLVDCYDLSCIVVTMGEQGVYALEQSGEEARVPGYKVEVVDLVGAGDALAAGFLSSYLKGEGLSTACEKGNLLGAMAAASKGATSEPEGELVANLKLGQVSRGSANSPVLNG
jgi:fructokinase